MTTAVYYAVAYLVCFIHAGMYLMSAITRWHNLSKSIQYQTFFELHALRSVAGVWRVAISGPSQLRLPDIRALPSWHLVPGRFEHV